jgi:hypothetical protein
MIIGSTPSQIITADNNLDAGDRHIISSSARLVEEIFDSNAVSGIVDDNRSVKKETRTSTKTSAKLTTMNAPSHITPLAPALCPCTGRL